MAEDTAEESLAKLDKQMEADEAWFLANKDFLMSNHRDEYVAVRNEKIMAHSTDREVVLEAIDKIGQCWMDKVEEESFHEKEDWETRLPLFVSLPPHDERRCRK